MGVSKAFEVFYGAANMPVGHTISLDYDTALPGKSRITHPISPASESQSRGGGSESGWVPSHGARAARRVI